MISIETRLDIERPSAEVFAFVSDHTNAPLWQRGLHNVRRLTEAPIGVGTEHVFERRFAGRLIESRNRFTQYDQARLFVEFEILEGWITEANGAPARQPVRSSAARTRRALAAGQLLTRLGTSR